MLHFFCFVAKDECLAEKDKALLQSLMFCTSCLCSSKFLSSTSISSCKKNFPSLIIGQKAKKERNTGCQCLLSFWCLAALPRSHLSMYFDSLLFQRWIITSFPSVGKERMVRLIPKGAPPSLAPCFTLFFNSLNSDFRWTIISPADQASINFMKRKTQTQHHFWIWSGTWFDISIILHIEKAKTNKSKEYFHNLQ